jgi:hypothetical protein
VGQREKILEFLRALDRPVSPFFISKSLGINPNSTRARIHDLLRIGLVERVAPGLYSIVPTHGVGKPPRIQNFTAVVHPSPAVQESERWEYVFQGPPLGEEGLVRIALGFGKKRNKITWTIRAPLGLDYYGLMFSYALVQCELARRGYTVKDTPGNLECPECFMVRVIELLDDKIGLGLEGVKCLTFHDLSGNFEKIYEKKYGVRREVRFTEQRPISDLLALYQGGFPSFMVAQSSYDIARAVEKNTETLKHLYRNQAELNRITNQVLKALWKIIDKDS